MTLPDKLALAGVLMITLAITAQTGIFPAMGFFGTCLIIRAFIGAVKP